MDADMPFPVTRLSHVVGGVRDGTHGSYERVNEGFPLLSAKNVRDSGLRLSDAESQISQRDYDSIVKSGFPKSGDVLLTIVGSIGRSTVFEESESIAFQRSVAFLRPNALVRSRFLSYQLQSKHFQEQLELRTKTSAQPGVYLGDVSACWVVVPSTTVQEQIERFLDRETAEIDAFIADQEELIALLTERRAATISHTVTKGLDPSAPMKDSGIEWLGEIPSSWSTPKVKWHASIRNGATPSREEFAYWSAGSIPWLSSTVVNLPEVVEPTELVTEFAVESCHLPMIPRGSVLVGLTGQGKTRGMATLLAFESTINQHIAAITPRTALNSDFLHWVITAAYQQLRFESDGNGGTKGGLTCQQLGSLRIPMPPNEEQTAITERLISETAEIDAAVVDAREAIALSKERRAALISAAVTGKIDVRNHRGVD